MVASLIATKVQIPPLPLHQVSRDRLVERIEQTLPAYRLLLLAAPAGYGKSTLLVQWARASRMQVAWFSIDAEDNDFARFFRYLLAAWAQVEPSVTQSRLGLLLGSIDPDHDAVLTAWLNVANDVSQHTVFVLDDYHLIEDPAIHRAVEFLLDHLPPRLHVVLAARGEPPLPLARYRARQQLLDIGIQDLRLQPDEAADLLARMNIHLAPHEAANLHAQVEGWAAGLQLAALALQQRLTETDSLVVGGRQRFIADYLSQEVLAHLPDAVQRFLLQTSILDRLGGPLCESVTGEPGAQTMLEQVERAGLFLLPLDDSRGWFRYHPIFADFLQQELHRRYPHEVVPLHRKAARWYLAQELPEPAFHHALAGDDPQFILRIFERYINLKLNAGEVNVVAGWLDLLPTTWYAAYPLLELCRAGLFAITGAFEASRRSIDAVEQRLLPVEGQDTRWQLAMVRALQCFIACIQNDLGQAQLYAHQATRDLRAESFSFRASIYHALGDTYRGHARWAQAKENYLRALQVIDASGFRVLALVQGVHVLGALADLELRQGRLQQAAGYWRQALAAIQEPETWGRLELPVTGWVFIRMSEILYEWNQLDEAGDYLAQGLERAELGGDPQARMAGYLLGGRLGLAAGEIAAAQAHLARARLLVENAPFPDWAGRFARFQLEVWLAQDQLRAARNWAGERLQDDAQLSLDNEAIALAMARALVMQRDASSLDRALALLRQLLPAAEAEGRVGVQIEALALHALADWRRDDPVSAMTYLERGLRLAEPEGYLRLFADLGLPMGRLLQEARARKVMPDYVARLLAAFGDSLPEGTGGSLPEPLSARELEVLHLLAAGLTNREIGEQLVISAETVKKHTSSIFGKLSVRTRTEAVSRARDLDLLV